MLHAGDLLQFCGFFVPSSDQCSCSMEMPAFCPLTDLLHERFVCLSAVCGAVACMPRQRCGADGVLDVMPRFTFPLAANLPPAGFCPYENGKLTGHLQCCALSRKCSLNSLWKQILDTSVLEALGVLSQMLMHVLSIFV